MLLDELRRDGLHLTGIFLLSTRLTEANQLLAQWFPKPDLPVALIGPGTLAGQGETGAGAGLAGGTCAGNRGTGGTGGASGSLFNRLGRLRPLSDGR